ncbi:hypothetical protein [Mesorhizobium sp. CAU 1741]|uniref:hypothetical protein n=1 Tax=Mesorhizobium sp. CAU 1741 TaxID=3140366 RepID=UPI00325C27FB
MELIIRPQRRSGCSRRVQEQSNTNLRKCSIRGWSCSSVERALARGAAVRSLGGVLEVTAPFSLMGTILWRQPGQMHLHFRPLATFSM